ncbi:hypothetical protein R0J90_17360, partial [Micrococcus sp. SIMBA_144]
MFETTIEKFILFSVTSIGVIFFLLYVKIQKLYQQERHRQSNYIAPLLGIVRSLPKEELADMAEALVNLTSFKRRVSRATESVG